MAHDVFISYSSHDKSIADTVCASLEAAKIRCWIAPRDMLPGVPYGEALGQALRESQILLLVFSSNSNRSSHVMREVESAVDKGIPILPFRVEDVKPSASLDYFVKAIHWLDAITPPLEIHLLSLVETVRMLLTRQCPGPVVPELPGPADAIGTPKSPTPALPRTELPKKRSRFATGYVFAGLGVALVILVLLAMAMWRPGGHSTEEARSPSSAGRSPLEPEPKASAEMIQAKSDADLAWQRSKSIDPADGFGTKVQDIEFQLRAAMALFDKNRPEAVAELNRVVVTCRALMRADEERQQARAARKQADRARLGAEQASAKEGAPTLWAAAEGKYTEAVRLFEAGDFVRANERWGAAWAGYATASKALAELPKAQKAQAAYEVELAKCNRKELEANGGEVWQRIAALTKSTLESRSESRFAEMAVKYDEALRLLPDAQRAAKQLQARYDAWRTGNGVYNWFLYSSMVYTAKKAFKETTGKDPKEAQKKIDDALTMLNDCLPDLRADLKNLKLPAEFCDQMLQAKDQTPQQLLVWRSTLYGVPPEK